ncbi:MAG: EpsI family protein [Deltaproteobacteria bacterium]|jgi:EpsI family protein|nr:EpsI family protein [Deltaproteobacteria bacterium]
MIGLFRYLSVYVLLGITALFIYTHETIAVPVNRPLQEIPSELNGWTMEWQSRFSQQMLESLQPTDYLYRSYIDHEGHKVALYIGYHSGGPESGPIHSPKHCLPGSGWFEISEKQVDIRVGDSLLPIVQAIYQKGNQKELFIYYFLVKGKVLTNEYALKFAEIKNSILYKRKDSAFIRVSLPVQGSDDQAISVAESFTKMIHTHIQDVLPL